MQQAAETLQAKIHAQLIEHIHLVRGSVRWDKMPTVAAQWRQGVNAFRPSACRITMKDVWFRQGRLQTPAAGRARNYGYLNIDAASDQVEDGISVSFLRT